MLTLDLIMVLILDGNSEIDAHGAISVTWHVEGIWLCRELSRVDFFLKKDPFSFVVHNMFRVII